MTLCALTFEGAGAHDTSDVTNEAVTRSWTRVVAGDTEAGGLGS